MLQMSSLKANTQIDPKDIGLAQKKVEEFGAIFTSASNVHTHTRKLGKGCSDIFLKLDNQYQLSKSTNTFPIVAAEILSISANNKNVARVLAALKLPRAKKDLETGLNVQDLLVRAWTLASQPDAADHSRELLIDNLNHNLAAGGGCIPGIAARLVQPYSLFVLHKLEKQRVDAFLGTPAQASEAAKPAASDEDELALAVKESLLISAPSAMRAQTARNTLPVVVVDEKKDAPDEDLEMAIALSLSMTSK